MHRGHSMAGEAVVEAIWNGSSNCDLSIQNVALGFTNAIRMLSPADPDAEFASTAFAQGVRIRWAWIALPALTLVASVVLLLVAMVRKRKLR